MNTIAVNVTWMAGALSLVIMIGIALVWYGLLCLVRIRENGWGTLPTWELLVISALMFTTGAFTGTNPLIYPATRCLWKWLDVYPVNPPQTGVDYRLTGNTLKALNSDKEKTLVLILSDGSFIFVPTEIKIPAKEKLETVKVYYQTEDGRTSSAVRIEPTPPPPNPGGS